MKRLFASIAVGITCLLLAPHGSAQVPARGFSVLLCVVERAGSVPGGAEVNIDILSDEAVNESGLRQAVVTVNHGESSSTHLVLYQDTDGNERLNCQDIVVSVT
jgi:hypothetical protein